MNARSYFNNGRNTFTLNCPFCGKQHVVQHKFWRKVDHYVDECIPLTFNCVFSRGGKHFPRGKVVFITENYGFLVVKIIPHNPIFNTVFRAIYWGSIAFDPSTRIATFEEEIRFKPKTRRFLDSMSYLKAKVREHGYKNPNAPFKLQFSLKID